MKVSPSYRVVRHLWLNDKTVGYLILALVMLLFKFCGNKVIYLIVHNLAHTSQKIIFWNFKNIRQEMHPTISLKSELS